MKSLFDTSTQQEVLQRIDNLNNNTKAQWGKMNVDQMLKHCQGPLEVAIENKQLNSKIGFMKKIIFKAFKPTMYNDKLWGHNIPTVKEYVITKGHNFDTEKIELKKVIHEFSALKAKDNWPKHPLFGRFTPEQWGKLQYKHLDHHFRQFNV